MIEPLDTHKLTWAALLGQWVEFARSALALPDTPEGRALRAAVPDIIALQAVTCALQRLDALSETEQAVGRDRAGVLIERHAAQLQKHFPDSMPGQLRELIEDAQRALEIACEESSEG